MCEAKYSTSNHLAIEKVIALQVINGCRSQLFFVAKGFINEVLIEQRRVSIRSKLLFEKTDLSLKG